MDSYTTVIFLIFSPYKSAEQNGDILKYDLMRKAQQYIATINICDLRLTIALLTRQ